MRSNRGSSFLSLRLAALFFVVLLSTFLGEVPGSVGGGHAIAADGRALLPYWGPEGMQDAETPQQVATVLKTAALLTFLTLAPSLLILTTCFTRIIIVLSFVRRALSTQTLPPDQVMIGLALFLTIYIMSPTWKLAWNDGLRPYLDGEISAETGQAMSQEEAFERVLAPTRAFMFACLEHNRAKEELYFFLGVSGNELPEPEDLTRDKVPTEVLIPAFITSELKRAFWMGFLLYLPFLILDVVIASVLMSMGMMMLPPVMISLPFKIILFVLVDGWRLLMEGIVTSFPVEMLPALQAAN
ncbi:MAG: flagellar type III secretion system pore protein FliP [Planctomycetes bacterium]|nr:flagellar type III secretion system pore protein FliP [Planctomycetota bacterium]